MAQASYVNFGGGGGSSRILTVVGIIAVVVLLYYAYRKGLFSNLFGGKLGAAAGDTATGWNVYSPVSGSECGGKDGSQTIGCSGNDVWSVRSDHDGCALTNYEATGIMVFKQNSTCKCGTEFDVKIGGPSHGDGNCCWWLFCINNDGSGGITTGGEGPHPDTDKDCKNGVLLDTIGDVQGKKIGIKAITWANQDGTRHFEGWVDPSGSGTSWQIAAQVDSAEWGMATGCGGDANKSSSTIPSDQQVEFRCDCDDAQWEKTTVQEIVPNQRADGTTTAPTGGGGTTPGGGGGGGNGDTGDGDGDTGDGDGDTGDGDGDTGDGDGGGGTTAECNEEEDGCICPGGGTVPLTGSETCSACATKCGSAAAVRRRRRSTRRSNLARKSFYSYSYRFTKPTVLRGRVAKICL